MAETCRGPASPAMLRSRVFSPARKSFVANQSIQVRTFLMCEANSRWPRLCRPITKASGPTIGVFIDSDGASSGCFEIDEMKIWRCAGNDRIQVCGFFSIVSVAVASCRPLNTPMSFSAIARHHSQQAECQRSARDRPYTPLKLPDCGPKLRCKCRNVGKIGAAFVVCAQTQMLCAGEDGALGAGVLQT